MVLTSTGTLSVLTAGRAEVKTMIMSALGCNLAWGVIDAGMYLMGSLEERGRSLLTLRTVRQSTNPDAAKRAIADALPELACIRVVARRFGIGETEIASATGAALASPSYKGRLPRRARRLPAGFHFDIADCHSLLIRQ